MKRTLVLSLLILSAFALTACGGTTTVEAAPDSVVENAIIAEGHLEPADFANLAFPTSGVVEEVLVSEGETVAAAI